MVQHENPRTQHGVTALDTLRACFSGRLLIEELDTAPFLIDWRKRWHGRAIAVAQPDTTLGVASIMEWCSRHAVPVVPQGGNTSLSGGSVPDRSGLALVLSLARLNRLRGIDTVGKTIVAEAGCTLHAVQQAARQADLLFPLSMASEGRCTIGGILSTNAGGVHVLRYGNARALCLGLEVVTPAGEIWDGLRGLAKDNSGLHLRDLFIGAEGTLGIITAAVLKLSATPADRSVAFAAVPSPDAALRLLAMTEAWAGAGLTAFELMSDVCLDLVCRHREGLRCPVGHRAPWYVLIELSVWPGVQASGEMTALLADALEQGCIVDASVAVSLAQSGAFWAVREAISEAQGAEGSTIKHDISLPIAGVPAFLDIVGKAVARGFPGLRPVVFGHLGDGNLHYNLSPPADRCGRDHAPWFLGLEPAVNRVVHDLVIDQGGSISAEHGVGVLRRHEAARYKSPVELRLMGAIRSAIDPLGLMNPGKGVATDG